MMEIYQVDYIIDLSTGEKLHISEFDPERIPEMQDLNVINASSDVLDHCTMVPRNVMEDAKHGYDTEFKKLLRTPPIGALLKTKQTLCSERDVCSMYDASKCTTRNIAKGSYALPICWEADVSHTKYNDHITAASRTLRTAVIHAWRRGMLAVRIG